ncbi:MAG: hypothetical protein IJM30_05750 [Thermoguttaceae bacterium]|nr:hypothetical protein [Thermoguttaceae bacterium]
MSTANEIASVVKDGAVDPVRTGERLRRLLQWIFDKTYKFELEDLRAKGREEVVDFLKTVPYSTSFMNAYASFFALGGDDIPLDEAETRVLRLLGWVVVEDSREVAPCLKDAFNESDARDFFFALHELGVDLADEKKNKEALKFLVSFDSNASKRSPEPLVEPSAPSDPREIARIYSRRERRPKNGMSTVAMMRSEMEEDDFDDKVEDEFLDSGAVDNSRLDKGELSICSGPDEEASITKETTAYVGDVSKSAKISKSPARVLRDDEPSTSSDSISVSARESLKPRKPRVKKSTSVEPKSEKKSKTTESVDSTKTAKKKRGGSDGASKEKENVVKPAKKTKSEKTRGAESKSGSVSGKGNVSKSVKTETGTIKKEKKSSSTVEEVPPRREAKGVVASSSKSNEAKKLKGATSSRSKKTQSVDSVVPRTSSRVESASNKKKEAAPTVKTTKSVSRGRNRSSEPPDASTGDAEKKSARRSTLSRGAKKTAK